MAEAKIKRPEDKTTKRRAEALESLPAGMARCDVRGFFASNLTSAIRLKPMAAERAPIIAIRIQKIAIKVMVCSREASTTAESAKGRAKIVWLNLIILP
ncbi:MAG: hypothetical protein JRI32_10210 [Deltaproteobacteria bacterium]|nr:hypothetical protein [Deltaproteobacteria bacterium]